jgi:Sulfotransferase family
MRTKRLILVTGMPRSGTTAVGEVLATAARTSILHEPLNYLVGLRDVPHYFALPGGGGVTGASFDRWVADIRALKLRYKPGVFPKEKGLHRLMKRLLGGRAVNSYRRCVWTPGLDTLIWKDPFACLAARYLHEVHGIPVVVTLRNPWAVAASFKRMRWAFDLDEIFSRIQSAAQQKYSFDNQIWLRRDEPVVNAALLWLIVYSSLQDLLTAEGGLIGVSLDELIQRPTAVYAALFDRLGLAWTESVERSIVSRYQGKLCEPQVPVGEKAHDRKRDLASMNQYWTNLLDVNEQALVSDLCGELWGMLGALRVDGIPATEPWG